MVYLEGIRISRVGNISIIAITISVKFENRMQFGWFQNRSSHGASNFEAVYISHLHRQAARSPYIWALPPSFFDEAFVLLSSIPSSNPPSHLNND